MAKLKLVEWNMEWMNDLFVPNDEPVGFRPDDEIPPHAHEEVTVKQRRDDLSAVLQELDPDIVVVVEGPNRDGELRLFFDSDMPGQWATKIQYSKGMSQNLGIAVRTDTGAFADPPFEFYDTNEIAVFDPFEVDIDENAIVEKYKFERRPLYVQVNPGKSAPFRLLGLHLKSKAVFGAYEWSKWWQMADANRKNILAQATHLRLNFLDTYLRDDETGTIPLIVCGDINDGPGWDEYKAIRFPGDEIESLYPNLKPKWLNVYDKDDVLGYPITQLTDEYKELMQAGYLEDRPLNVGAFWKSWNPLSHKGYFRDEDSLDELAGYLADVWKGAYASDD